jgi:hypothetical protein
MQAFEVFGWALGIFVVFVRSINKDAFEEISSPLDSVLNLVREVLKSTQGDRFFSWILGITVALSVVWNDDLTVTFGTQSSGFEQVFVVENASAIDEKSGLDVINGVGNSVQAFPEVVRED